jgi:hypothetical protein
MERFWILKRIKCYVTTEKIISIRNLNKTITASFQISSCKVCIILFWFDFISTIILCFFSTAATLHNTKSLHLLKRPKVTYATTSLVDVRWYSLRYCATNRKVAGSIPDGVIEIFLWLNPSVRIMTLGSTQPLKEMSIRNISWGWMQPLRRAEKLTTFTYRLSRNLGVSILWTRWARNRPAQGSLYPLLCKLAIFPR